MTNQLSHQRSDARATSGAKPLSRLIDRVASSPRIFGILVMGLCFFASSRDVTKLRAQDWRPLGERSIDEPERFSGPGFPDQPSPRQHRASTIRRASSVEEDATDAEPSRDVLVPEPSYEEPLHATTQPYADSHHDDAHGSHSADHEYGEYQWRQDMPRVSRRSVRRAAKNYAEHGYGNDYQDDNYQNYEEDPWITSPNGGRKKYFGRKLNRRASGRGKRARLGMYFKTKLFSKQGNYRSNDPYAYNPYEFGPDELHGHAHEQWDDVEYGEDFPDEYGEYYSDPEWDDSSCIGESWSDWNWQFLPESLMYKTYMAGTKEPRLGSALLYDSSIDRWFLDTTLGARVGLIRYGTPSDLPPEGWQLDVEGAVFPRFDADKDLNLQSADIRFGIPLTWARGPYQAKIGYLHMSSHLGDEFMILNPGVMPNNFVRNSIVMGFGYYLTDHFRFFGEADYAFSRSGGTEAWHFQIGTEYMPIEFGSGGAPFFACNSQFREETNYSGNINVMAGWAWHGTRTDHIVRTGVQYYNGKSSQYSFYRNHEELIGIGIWYDF